MKKNYIFSPLVIALIAVFFSIQTNGYSQIGVNGIELPPPDPACTNCDDCTTSDTKIASTLGMSNQATDSAAFASGKEAYATGQFSTAIGHYVKATNNNGIIIGFGDYLNHNYLQNTLQNTIMFGVGDTTPYLTIRNYGTYNGIGIKTSMPDADLDVNGSLRANNFRLDLSTQANYVLKSDASGNASWADPTALGIWALNGLSAHYMGGPVGIGTQTPGSTLDVDGTITASGLKLANGTEDDILKCDASGNVVWSTPEWLASTATTNKIFSSSGVAVAASTNDEIFSSFQIGKEFCFYGATHDANKVISSNYIWNSGAKRLFDGTASIISFDHYTGNISLTAAGDGLQNSPISGGLLVLTSAGRLGVGYNSPEYLLDVRGYNQVEAFIKSFNASKSALWTSNTAGNLGFGIDEIGNGHIYKDINQYDELITFYSDGKVLIGDEVTFTSENNHQLYVNGSIITTEVKIALVSSWADYVFKDNYKLPALSEVESFIRANGHLPGVPSEAEVKKEGINLAETDAMLLKKIEELTLYVLQQDKKIKALEDKLGKSQSGL